MFPDPSAFRPERFLKASTMATGAVEHVLDKDLRDPSSLIFGFGRRVCPGRHMTYEVLWLAMASVLAAFHLRPETDAEGRDAMPVGEYDFGVT